MITGASKGIVKLWRIAGHPITTEWNFLDPSDNNFFKITHNGDFMNNGTLMYEREEESMIETTERLQQKLREAVTQLEEQAERLENNVH